MERSGPSTTTALAPLFSCSSFGIAYPQAGGNRPTTKHEHDTGLLVPRHSLVTSPSPAIKLGLDLKASVYQSLDDDFSRSFGVKNLGREVGAAEKVGQNLLRGELGRGALHSGKSKA